ncbi:hypothetical protein RHGRI_015015 [Rhododendron griersonianum]|uniref:Uncharacterized protein n=1 Tax=Rhododendron griersonianum TaxID=479676 RepID=A0AAV6KC62_9ERIC|nr:hypothetical protein RHGRI_015015 [Rhododendron griersonianum]
MEMGLSKLLAFFLFSQIFQTPASAVKQSYIVYMGVHSHGLKDAMASVSKVKESHNEFLASFLGSTEKAKESIFYSYTRDINGFAATLDEEEAAAIARHQNVVSVFLNKGKHLHTTHSWEFMLLEQNGVAQHSSLWIKASYGEDIIIGNLDTGVWPESESFSDKGFGAVPAKWKGFCENETSTGVPCNRKLIGARHFNKAYTSGGGELNASTNSPRDNDGHGSHTLSTAGGNFVPGASVFGLFNGTAKGGSPKARVAAYKVCWPPSPEGGECYSGDILAAFDAAIHDGVDVLSVSLGGPDFDYFEDAIALGSFHAVMNGVVVVCSAGNGGPGDYTVNNVAPWILTVGASTIDRKEQAFLSLYWEDVNSIPLSAAHTLKPRMPRPKKRKNNLSKDFSSKSMLCKEGTLDPKKVKGKILVCLNGDIARVEKGMIAALAGAVGMILCNDESDGNEIIADPHYLPASHINYTDGLVVYAYINSTKDPKAYITASTAEMHTEPAPFMASFSSKGPNYVTLEILKPDITAPGVNIIAAYTEAHSPTESDFDKRRTGFTTESGTSMSCPHVSGVVGLLKKLHPDWSPGAIKSAIMTTARTRDNTVNPMRGSTSMKATPFSCGAGHIRPNRAADPGLVYDLNANDYLDFLCGIGYNQTIIKLFSKAPYSCPGNFSLLDFNYPSITVPNLSGSVTVSRTVKNVGSPGVYAAHIREPRGVLVSVEPDVLKFDRTGEEKSFKLTLTNKKLGGAGEYVFGQLLWSDGRHHVRSPIVVASKAYVEKKSAQLGVAGGRAEIPETADIAGASGIAGTSELGNGGSHWSFLTEGTLRDSYIVYMGVHSHGLKDAMASVSKVKESHNEFLASFLGSTEKAKESIFYSYTRDINGFAATLDEEEAAAIARHPNVVSVFLNKGKHLHTTHSWEFMLLEQNGVAQHSSLWIKASYGEDIIIGNLDTGVWPESESFSDKGFGAVPSKWKGFCENDTSNGVPCNRKLIGARHFNKAYISGGGELNASTNSPRDNDGHGSHTLSTAGGNFVPGANVFGIFNGTAKGGSPKARVAAYKVCWPPSPEGGECYSGDILAAFDAAIHDGVDVLSVSLGGPAFDYFGDATAIGSFHAVMNGVVVVCSAGNEGPGDYTVNNVAPWILTVGASTIDRKEQAFLSLYREDVNSIPLSVAHTLKPRMPRPKKRKNNLSKDFSSKSMLCKEGTLDPKKVKGKILVCLRGDIARVEKGMRAALAGAVGMILCNDESDGNEIIADPHYLPASHINYTDGLLVYAYLNSTKDPKAYITASIAEIHTKPAPFMASFSSKGPNFLTPEILKPDITAPGVSIIAAYTEAHSPSENDFDKRRTGFTTESGTSMSCPHVSGVVGLLKKLHPDWSPGAIKSAIMTTARTRDNTVNPVRDSTSMKATPFSYGAGHIRPNRAEDPGLVYDLNANDYLDFLCGIGYNQTIIKLFSKAPYSCPGNFSLLDFNYPSITVPNLSGSVTVSRTVKNVGSPGVYAAHIREPRGVLVSVEPDVLKFDRTGEEKSFKLTLTNKKLGGAGEYVFGQLLWSDGRHHVRSPIVVASKAIVEKNSAQLGVAGGIRSGI